MIRYNLLLAYEESMLDFKLTPWVFIDSFLGSLYP